MQVHQALVPAIRLELLPKSTIDVFISVLENDGIESCVAAASIAASAALADAGIEMVGLVAACAAVSAYHHPMPLTLLTMAQLQSAVGEDIWLDPTENEVRLGRGALMLACMPALGSITSVWQSGSILPQNTIKVRTIGFL